MKLGKVERWFVNSPVRRIGQHLVMQWFKRTVVLKPGSTILEVGCGRGVGAKLIHDTYQPARLYLLDLDIRMIKKAARRTAVSLQRCCRIRTGNGRAREPPVVCSAVRP